MIYNKKLVNSSKSMARVISPANERNRRLFEEFTITLRNFFTGKSYNTRRVRNSQTRLDIMGKAKRESRRNKVAQDGLIPSEQREYQMGLQTKAYLVKRDATVGIPPRVIYSKTLPWTKAVKSCLIPVQLIVHECGLSAHEVLVPFDANNEHKIKTLIPSINVDSFPIKRTSNKSNASRRAITLSHSYSLPCLRLVNRNWSSLSSTDLSIFTKSTQRRNIYTRGAANADQWIDGNTDGITSNNTDCICGAENHTYILTSSSKMSSNPDLYSKYSCLLATPYQFHRQQPAMKILRSSVRCYSSHTKDNLPLRLLNLPKTCPDLLKFHRRRNPKVKSGTSTKIKKTSSLPMANKRSNTHTTESLENCPRSRNVVRNNNPLAKDLKQLQSLSNFGSKPMKAMNRAASAVTVRSDKNLVHSPQVQTRLQNYSPGQNHIQPSRIPNQHVQLRRPLGTRTTQISEADTVESAPFEPDQSNLQIQVKSPRAQQSPTEQATASVSPQSPRLAVSTHNSACSIISRNSSEVNQTYPRIPLSNHRSNPFFSESPSKAAQRSPRLDSNNCTSRPSALLTASRQVNTRKADSAQHYASNGIGCISDTVRESSPRVPVLNTWSMPSAQATSLTGTAIQEDVTRQQSPRSGDTAQDSRKAIPRYSDTTGQESPGLTLSNSHSRSKYTNASVSSGTGGDSAVSTQQNQQIELNNSGSIIEQSLSTYAQAPDSSSISRHSNAASKHSPSAPLKNFAQKPSDSGSNKTMTSIGTEKSLSTSTIENIQNQVNPSQPPTEVAICNKQSPRRENHPPKPSSAVKAQGASIHRTSELPRNQSIQLFPSKAQTKQDSTKPLTHNSKIASNDIGRLSVPTVIDMGGTKVPITEPIEKILEAKSESQTKLAPPKGVSYKTPQKQPSRDMSEKLISPRKADYNISTKQPSCAISPGKLKSPTPQKQPFNNYFKSNSAQNSSSTKDSFGIQQFKSILYDSQEREMDALPKLRSPRKLQSLAKIQYPRQTEYNKQPRISSSSEKIKTSEKLLSAAVINGDHSKSVSLRPAKHALLPQLLSPSKLPIPMKPKLSAKSDWGAPLKLSANEKPLVSNSNQPRQATKLESPPKAPLNTTNKLQIPQTSVRNFASTTQLNADTHLPIPKIKSAFFPKTCPALLQFGRRTNRSNTAITEKIPRPPSIPNVTVKSKPMPAKKFVQNVIPPPKRKVPLAKDLQQLQGLSSNETKVLNERRATTYSVANFVESPRDHTRYTELSASHSRIQFELMKIPQKRPLKSATTKSSECLEKKKNEEADTQAPKQDSAGQAIKQPFLICPIKVKSLQSISKDKEPSNPRIISSEGQCGSSNPAATQHGSTTLSTKLESAPKLEIASHHQQTPSTPAYTPNKKETQLWFPVNNSCNNSNELIPANTQSSEEAYMFSSTVTGTLSKAKKVESRQVTAQISTETVTDGPNEGRDHSSGKIITSELPKVSQADLGLREHTAQDLDKIIITNVPPKVLVGDKDLNIIKPNKKSVLEILKETIVNEPPIEVEPSDNLLSMAKLLNPTRPPSPRKLVQDPPLNKPDQATTSNVPIKLPDTAPIKRPQRQSLTTDIPKLETSTNFAGQQRNCPGIKITPSALPKITVTSKDTKRNGTLKVPRRQSSIPRQQFPAPKPVLHQVPEITKFGDSDKCAKYGKFALGTMLSPKILKTEYKQKIKRVIEKIEETTEQKLINPMIKQKINEATQEKETENYTVEQNADVLVEENTCKALQSYVKCNFLLCNPGAQEQSDNGKGGNYEQKGHFSAMPELVELNEKIHQNQESFVRIVSSSVDKKKILKDDVAPGPLDTTGVGAETKQQGNAAQVSVPKEPDPTKETKETHHNNQQQSANSKQKKNAKSEKDSLNSNDKPSTAPNRGDDDNDKLPDETKAKSENIGPKNAGGAAKPKTAHKPKIKTSKMKSQTTKKPQAAKKMKSNKTNRENSGNADKCPPSTDHAISLKDSSMSFLKFRKPGIKLLTSHRLEMVKTRSMSNSARSVSERSKQTAKPNDDSQKQLNNMDLENQLLKLSELSELTVHSCDTTETLRPAVESINYAEEHTRCRANKCYYIFKNPCYRSKTFKKSEWLALCNKPICKIRKRGTYRPSKETKQLINSSMELQNVGYSDSVNVKVNPHCHYATQAQNSNDVQGSSRQKGTRRTVNTNTLKNKREIPERSQDVKILPSQKVNDMVIGPEEVTPTLESVTECEIKTCSQEIATLPCVNTGRAKVEHEEPSTAWNSANKDTTISTPNKLDHNLSEKDSVDTGTPNLRRNKCFESNDSPIMTKRVQSNIQVQCEEPIIGNKLIRSYSVNIYTNKHQQDSQALQEARNGIALNAGVAADVTCCYGDKFVSGIQSPAADISGVICQSSVRNEEHVSSEIGDQQMKSANTATSFPGGTSRELNELCLVDCAERAITGLNAEILQKQNLPSKRSAGKPNKIYKSRNSITKSGPNKRFTNSSKTMKQLRNSIEDFETRTQRNELLMPQINFQKCRKPQHRHLLTTELIDKKGSNHNDEHTWPNFEELQTPKTGITEVTENLIFRELLSETTAVPRVDASLPQTVTEANTNPKPLVRSNFERILAGEVDIEENFEPSLPKQTPIVTKQKAEKEFLCEEFTESPQKKNIGKHHAALKEEGCNMVGFKVLKESKYFDPTRLTMNDGIGANSFILQQEKANDTNSKQSHCYAQEQEKIISTNASLLTEQHQMADANITPQTQQTNALQQHLESTQTSIKYSPEQLTGVCQHLDESATPPSKLQFVATAIGAKLEENDLLNKRYSKSVILSIISLLQSPMNNGLQLEFWPGDLTKNVLFAFISSKNGNTFKLTVAASCGPPCTLHELQNMITNRTTHSIIYRNSHKLQQLLIHKFTPINPEIITNFMTLDYLSDDSTYYDTVANDENQKYGDFYRFAALLQLSFNLLVPIAPLCGISPCYSLICKAHGTLIATVSAELLQFDQSHPDHSATEKKTHDAASYSETSVGCAAVTREPRVIEIQVAPFCTENEETASSDSRPSTDSCEHPKHAPTAMAVNSECVQQIARTNRNTQKDNPENQIRVTDKCEYSALCECPSISSLNDIYFECSEHTTLTDDEYLTVDFATFDQSSGDISENETDMFDVRSDQSNDGDVTSCADAYEDCCSVTSDSQISSMDDSLGYLTCSESVTSL